MYKILLTKDGQINDITNVISELSWNESIDNIGVSLSFCVPDIQNKYITDFKIMAGGIIQVFNDNGEMIRAIVVSVERNYKKRTVKANDFGFYLNKNDTVIQFKNKSVSVCLKELFSKVGITVGSICDMPSNVNKVFIKNVYTIIKELLEIQEKNDGNKYYFEMRCEKIFVFKMPTEPIKYIFKPAINVGAFDVTDKDAHGRGAYKHSIEDMKNCVIAIVNSKGEDSLPKKQFIARDETNINKYGLLAETFKVDSKEEKNIQQLAKNELKEKNKLKTELSMSFIGHDNARASRVMRIVDDYLGINDLYRIKSVNHTVKGANHTMNCTLEKI